MIVLFRCSSLKFLLDGLILTLVLHLSSPSPFPKAVNQAGTGPYSERVSFRTPATNPDPVTSLALLDIPASSESGRSPSTCLLLKWEEPNSNGAEITSYVVSVDEQRVTVETGTTHLVTDLQPDSEYRCSNSGPVLGLAFDITLQPLITLPLEGSVDAGLFFSRYGESSYYSYDELKQKSANLKHHHLR